MGGLVTVLAACTEPESPKDRANREFARKLQEIVGINAKLSENEFTRRVHERSFGPTAWLRPSESIGEFINDRGKSVRVAIAPDGEPYYVGDLIEPPHELFSEAKPLETRVLGRNIAPDTVVVPSELKTRRYTALVMYGSRASLEGFGREPEQLLSAAERYMSRITAPGKVLHVVLSPSRQEVELADVGNLGLRPVDPLMALQTDFKVAAVSGVVSQGAGELYRQDIVIRAEELAKLCKFLGITYEEGNREILANEILNAIGGQFPEEIRRGNRPFEPVSTLVGLAARYDESLANYLMTGDHVVLVQEMAGQIRVLESKQTPWIPNRQIPRGRQVLSQTWQLLGKTLG